MRAERLLGAIAEGRVAFGTGVHSPDPAIVEIIALAGYDWVSIVLEHAALTVEQIAVLQRAADSRGITTLIHVADAHDARIGPLLDEGVGGVIAPQLTSVADVKALVDLARFPPVGARGAAGGVRSADFGLVPYTQYVGEIDKSVAVGIVIETIEAVEDVEAIVAVEGVTLAFIGLMDLSQAYGVPGDFKHEKVRAAIDRIVAAGKEHGVTVGFSEYGYTAREVHDLGAGMILAPSSEYPFFTKALGRHLAEAKASLEA